MHKLKLIKLMDGLDVFYAIQPRNRPCLFYCSTVHTRPVLCVMPV